MTRPIWLLDVDGVLNALPNKYTEPAWPDLTQIMASPRHGDPYKYTITYSPTLIREIRELHESGAVEVRWLTTWGGGANGELREKLGLPEFVVAGEPDVRSGFAGAPRHGWWKFDDARRAHAAEPDRPFIWTDDDLADVWDAAEWADAAGFHTLAPELTTGITPTQLVAIREFIASHNALVA